MFRSVCNSTKPFTAIRRIVNIHQHLIYHKDFRTMSNTSPIYTAGLIGQNIERRVLYLHYSFDHGEGGIRFFSVHEVEQLIEL